ncbi:amino acid transporter [Morchella conica CCBAS932]|uniref:Amino acid transporter n=1 Tax=Morchella conica CCBAS932 TaxID=1392247 RepID=A0A3N4KCM9_9PEZI|nr:amino acid transporter [Morchella conica CCBAS932]
MPSSFFSRSPATAEDAPLLHKPALERNHTKLSMLGLAFAILNSWTALSASLSIALPSGGPSAVVWGLVVSGVCNLCLAASLAEFLAEYPTAGGQYHWVAVVSPAEWMPLLSWMCGWINCSGWVFLVATGGSLASQMVVGIASLLDPEYVATPGQMLSVYVAFTVTAFAINVFGSRVLPIFSRFAFIWSVSGVIVISATLLFSSAGTGYQSPSFVFTKFVNHTGWPNGIAWSLGLLQGSLALTGYDAVAHMIEEIPHASREGPKIMIYAVLIGMVTGFGFLLVLLFCMGSIEEVISAPCGPILAIFYHSTGSKTVSICLLIFPLVCLLFGTTTIMTTSSRMLYAFSRDRGLPFSSTFSIIHPKLHVPVNALLLTAVPVLLMGGLYLISTDTLNAFLSASVIALSLSYGFPVAINVFTGRTRLVGTKEGFRMTGWVGWAVNGVGLAFATGVTALFMLPPSVPKTWGDINWSPVVFLGVVIVSTVAWWLEGRGMFVGPRVILIEEGEEGEEEEEED